MFAVQQLILDDIKRKLNDHDAECSLEKENHERKMKNFENWRNDERKQSKEDARDLKGETFGPPSKL